jgi:hypothetical protein
MILPGQDLDPFLSYADWISSVYWKGRNKLFRLRVCLESFLLDCAWSILTAPGLSPRKIPRSLSGGAEDKRGQRPHRLSGRSA